MKKMILTAMLIGMVGFAKAQWTYKKIDNGLDLPYKVAFTETYRNAFLKMENVDGDIWFYMKADYFCNDEVNVDFPFLSMVSGSGITSMRLYLQARILFGLKWV